MKKLSLFCAILWVATVGLALPDEVAEGRDLAVRWCTGCHVVGPGIAGGTVGPGFAEIAQRPGRTEATLFNWMIAPHPPMPDVDISHEESERLTAYILSLKE